MEPTLNFHIQTAYTQFKVPTELLKKNFKGIQRLIEKQKKQLAGDLAKIQKNPNLPKAIRLEMIRKSIKSFETFEKRLLASISKDCDLTERLVARLENLQELTKFIKKDDNKDEFDKDKDKTDIVSDAGHDEMLDFHNDNLINWYKVQANILIVDYLIKSKVKSDMSIGLKLLKNLSVSDPKLMKLIDYDLLEHFNNVFVSIVEDHDLSLIVTWFEENRNSLKKINSNLEFEINYCRFLSYIEQGKTEEAIKFSQLKLSENGNKLKYQDSEMDNYYQNLEKLKSMGGLLVYLALNENESQEMSFSANLVKRFKSFHTYEKLLSDDRWVDLGELFIDNFTKLYGISKTYPLYIYLSAGLSSLKTKSCYYNTQNTIFINEDKVDEPNNPMPSTDPKYRGPNYYYKILNKINDCPVCSPELYKLSRNLPYAQLITSMFNNPFKLPNGNIYPFDKLLHRGDQSHSEKNLLLKDCKIKDPLTNEIFHIDDCIKVYPA